MENSNLADRFKKHFSNLGRLSLSILEFYVKKVIGGEAVKILREPYEEMPDDFARILEALSNTEQKLKNDISREFFSVPISNLNGVMQAASSLENTIDFDGFLIILENQISSHLPHINTNIIKNWSEKYVDTLKLQMISLSNASFTDRVSTATLVQILKQLSESHSTDSINAKEQTELLKAILDALINLSKQTHTTTSGSVKKTDLTNDKKNKLLRAIIKWSSSVSGRDSKIEYLHKVLNAPIAGSGSDDRLRELLNWCSARENKTADLIAEIGRLDSPDGESYSDSYKQILDI